MRKEVQLLSIYKEDKKGVTTITSLTTLNMKQLDNKKRIEGWSGYSLSDISLEEVVMMLGTPKNAIDLGESGIFEISESRRNFF